MEKSCNLLLYSAITRMLPSVVYIKRYFKINPKSAKVLFVPFADESNKYYLALCKQALMLAFKKAIFVRLAATHIKHQNLILYLLVVEMFVH